MGDKDARLSFNENVSWNLGASYFGDGEVPVGHRRVTLEVRQAKAAIERLNLDQVDLIKVDVEGMEEAVLSSLKPVIARFRPMVAFEHHENKVDAGTFDRIRACFPKDYRFMEPVVAPPGSAWSKLRWNLEHDGKPQLIEVTVPEPKHYEALVALPSRE